MVIAKNYFKFHELLSEWSKVSQFGLFLKKAPPLLVPPTETKERKKKQDRSSYRLLVRIIMLLSFQLLLLCSLFLSSVVTITRAEMTTTCDSSFFTPSVPLNAEAKIGVTIPSANVDLVVPGPDGFIFAENEDLGAALASHSKVVVFALPGAFTPTCSAKHLPGFIEKAEEIRSRGVEAVYCLSVNDKFVMKAWGEATKGSFDSGIIFVADGNAAFTKALGAENDRTSGRMGLRSQRYAFIAENGKITHFFHDSTGLLHSSAENVLKNL